MLKRATIITLAALLATGCQKQHVPTPEEVGKAKLVIKGSNTIGEELAPRLIERFREKYPNVTVELEAKGTTTGFAALLNGEADIATASRPPSDDELRLAKSNGLELNRNVIGYYGVAVVVNAGSSIGKLSNRQVRDVFTGTIKNWKELGGADLPIRVCIRDAGSGTHLGFREIAMEGQSYAGNATTFTNYETLVESVRTNSGAIGYASMVAAEQHKGIIALPINGISPSVLTVNEVRYPYARGLGLNTVKSREPLAATAFIRFVQSSEGQKILSNAGFVRRFEPKLFSSASD